MADNDAIALGLASQAVSEIDVRYRLADAIDQDALADSRDRAWTAYAMARRRMLAQGVIVTDTDLAALERLSGEIAHAAEISALAQGALSLANLLGRVALA